MKKITVLILTVMCMLSFAGCGKKEDLQQPVEDKTDVTFEGKNMELEGIDGRVVSYTIKNGQLYVLAVDEADGSYQFFSADEEEKHAALICSEPLTEKDISFFCVDAAGNMIYLLSSADHQESGIELVKVDGSGKELFRQDIAKTIHGDPVLISGIVSDNRGQTVLACGERIYLFDEQLQPAGELQTEEGYVVDLALTKNGEIVCVTDLLDDMLTLKVYLPDAQAGKWGEPVAVPLEGNAGNDYVADGAEYDFYYKGRSGIYGYDLEAGAQTELINYDASYLTSVDTDGMMCMDQDMFIGKSESFADGKKQITLVSYTRKDPADVCEKEVITFGTFYAHSGLKSAVARFNRGSAEYQVVIEEYFDMDEERLLADIAAGKGQDIMDLSTFPLSLRQCISQGLIEDLTPYYEKDSEFSPDNMIASVREAMAYDGKLYYVTPCFSVTTIAARTEDVGDRDGWTVAELRQLVEEKGKEVDLFDSVDTKMEYFWCLLEDTISDYMDWESGTCHFDSEDFRYILELCNEKGAAKEENVSDAEIMEEVDSQYTRLQNGAYMLLRESEISLRKIQFDRKALDAGITYIGLPNRERQGSYFSFNWQFAISSQSQVKEQAWEFIRTFMSREYQKSLNNDSWMPVFQDMFDSRIKELTATEAYVNEYGEVIEPIEEDTMEWGDVQVVMGAPAQEDIDVYLDLIQQTKRCGDVDEVVFDIICEEAESYFKGRRKLDKTIDIIQKRVTTYMSEQEK
ncbi:MAG: extracellular solute-binding protein [Clostridium sp.]|nr:extracellular solute-binding protein [Clostridium sp.]